MNGHTDVKFELFRYLDSCFKTFFKENHTIFWRKSTKHNQRNIHRYGLFELLKNIDKKCSRTRTFNRTWNVKS